MLSKKMLKILNEQINKEAFSAYLYLAMSAKMSEQGYKGYAKWLMIQYHEEMFHSMKLYGYIQDQGASVELKTLEEPKFKSSTIKELFQQVLEHEQFITKSIHEIAIAAEAEKDFATLQFINWYVEEQIEEEKSVTDMLQTIDLLGNTPQGLFLLNIECGKRELDTFTDFTKM